MGKIKELINKLNDRILSIDEKQIGMIDFVIAVAGGSKVKFNAIWSILMRENPIVHVLCTDSETAKLLCDEHMKYMNDGSFKLS